MNLSILKENYCICRLNPNDSVPEWVNKNGFWTITQTQNELSIVCQDNPLAESLKSQRDWKIIKAEGILDFNLTGILSSIAKPLAKAKISIFAISTFDTDYILIKRSHVPEAISALQLAGFTFTNV
jgi:hypothetical protein